MNSPALKNAWLLALLLATTAVDAQDKTCRDLSFPGHVQINGTDLKLNGLGVRRSATSAWATTSESGSPTRARSGAGSRAVSTDIYRVMLGERRGRCRPKTIL